VRCHAYLVPSETYHDLEPQLLEQLRDGDREQLAYLLGDSDLEVELLSAEWRLLFDAWTDSYQVVDEAKRIARMMVAPDELPEFVRLVRDPELRQRWSSVTFGLAELADALPPDCNLTGIVILEESDDWQWSEPTHEIVAIRPEVFELVDPFVTRLLDSGDHAMLVRLMADHCEGAIELSSEQWRNLQLLATEQTPELLGVISGRISAPSDYTSIREALTLIADPRYQPSLDAWLRVHAGLARYALYFRDASLENEPRDVPTAILEEQTTSPLRTLGS